MASREDDAEPDVAAAEAELEDARARVASSMNTLGDELARRSDWREHIRKHPLAILGAALGGGYALGGGLSAPVTARLLKGGARLALQFALLPALEREVATLASKVGESLKERVAGDSDGVDDGDDPQGVD
jgi:hypothetical protein